MSSEAHRDVLLVGSFPFKTAAQVFDVVGPPMAGYAKRLPDGEAQGWVNFAGASLARAKGLKLGERTGQNQPELPEFRLYERDPAKSDLAFDTIGYDRIARDSYQTFRQARDAGKIAAGTRFQVSLPTPFGVIGQFVVPEDVESVLPVFERDFLLEVNRIIAAIPAEDLAIQWDIAVEIINGLLGHRPGLKDRFSIGSLSGSIARASDRIPPNVELGLHFCYGNPGGRHIIEPTDTSLMVAFANTIMAVTKRPITWLHMPVPKNRDDTAYFEALKNLKLTPATEFYLGLVHLSDGIAGAERRIAAAKTAAPKFGVAYECGLRMFPEESIKQMLQLHKDVAQIA
jgi:hypothetical protein